MNTVKVNKCNLLDELIKNREQHILNYNRVISAYTDKTIKDLQLAAKAMLDGEKYSLFFDSKPKSNIDDYDSVIKMVKMSVDDVIELTDVEFNQFVMDNWRWKDQFNTSLQTYGISD